VRWLGVVLVGLVACLAAVGAVGGQNDDDWTYQADWGGLGHSTWRHTFGENELVVVDTDAMVLATGTNCSTVRVKTDDFRGPAGVAKQGELYWVEGETEYPIHWTLQPYQASTYQHYTNETAWLPLTASGCAFMGHTGLFRFKSPRPDLGGAGADTETYVRHDNALTLTWWVDGADPVLYLHANDFKKIKPKATPTPCATPSPVPSPTTCPGGVCELTEAQGVDFVNGVQALVILVAIGVPCLVALVTGVSFLFFRRG
jgi:hypothetical protein